MLTLCLYRIFREYIMSPSLLPQDRNTLQYLHDARWVWGLPCMVSSKTTSKIALTNILEENHILPPKNEKQPSTHTHASSRPLRNPCRSPHPERLGLMQDSQIRAVRRAVRVIAGSRRFLPRIGLGISVSQLHGLEALGSSGLRTFQRFTL